MCRVLGVSKSGYSCWLDRPPSLRALDDEVMSEKIVSIHAQSRRTYGYRRIREELVDAHDEHISKHRVARLMKSAGIQGVTRRKFCRTTRRDESARPAPDLLGARLQSRWS
jgi:putative transposase